MEKRAYQKNLSKEAWVRLGVQEKINFLEDAAQHSDLKRLDIFLSYDENNDGFNYATRMMKSAQDNPKTIEHILQNHMASLDFEVALQDVIIADNLPAFKMMCKYMPKAQRKQHDFWKDLGVEDKDLNLMDDFAASTSKSKHNIFDPNDLVEFTALNQAYKIMDYLLDSGSLNRRQLGLMLKASARKGGAHLKQDFFFKMLNMDDADVCTLDHMELSTLVLQLPESVKHPVIDNEIRIIADDYMDYALRCRNTRLIEILLNNYKDNLKKPYDHAFKALGSTVDVIFDQFKACNFPQLDQAMADFLTENARKNVRMEFYVKVASHVDVEKLDGHFIRNFCEKGTPNHGWRGLEKVLERGFDLSKHPQAASGLLPYALIGSVKKENIDKIIDLPYLSNRTETYTQVMRYNDLELLQKLRDKHDMHPDQCLDWDVFDEVSEQRGDRFREMSNWVKAQFESRRKELREEAEALFENLDFKSTTKEDWKGGLLAQAMQTPKAGDILSQLSEKTGIRFTANEFVWFQHNRRSAFDILTGLRYEIDLLRHPYWDQDLEQLSCFVNAMPDAVKEKLGEDFLKERETNRSLNTLKQQQKPLRRRRAPRNP